MSFILCSMGEIFFFSIQVVIGDIMGELMLFYGIVDFVFVGGSLVECGGYNLLELVVYVILVLMGLYIFNFKDICVKLQQDDGLIIVIDVDLLVREVFMFLIDEDYCLWYGCYVVEVLYQNQGVLLCLLQLL